jgi:8-oxo-dGTP diphosphatase
MAAQPPQVRVGVGVFILTSSSTPTNPTFLIGKRINSHGSGTYALPGGHLEFGETPEECAEREIMEETGLKVSGVRFLTATNDYMQAEGKHYITMFVVCKKENERDEAKVLEPEKCAGWEWATWDEMVGWARAAESGEGSVQKKLFLPLTNLLKQRPGMVPSL